MTEPADGKRPSRSSHASVRVRGARVARESLKERMARFSVPGVSVAVADGGRTVWARGIGIADTSSGAPVTTRTIFQAGSISKAISATATLRLVERGVVDLDTDVNRYLTSWRVPDNPLTSREKVTLRRLITHSAGTTVHGFLGIPAGTPLPTLIDVLEGRRSACKAGEVYVGDPLAYPARAAGGLWTAPTDLLRWAIQIADAARVAPPECYPSSSPEG